MTSSAEFERLSARIDGDVRAAEQRAEDALRFRAQADAIRGTATQDGVSVTVDASGALIGLTLPRDLSYRDSDSLARTVLAATRSAYAEVRRRLDDVASEAFGVDSPIVDRLREEMRRRASTLAPDSGESGPGVLR